MLQKAVMVILISESERRGKMMKIALTFIPSIGGVHHFCGYCIESFDVLG